MLGIFWCAKNLRFIANIYKRANAFPCVYFIFTCIHILGPTWNSYSTNLSPPPFPSPAKVTLPGCCCVLKHGLRPPSQLPAVVVILYYGVPFWRDAITVNVGRKMGICGCTFSESSCYNNNESHCTYHPTIVHLLGNWMVVSSPLQ